MSIFIAMATYDLVKNTFIVDYDKSDQAFMKQLKIV